MKKILLSAALLLSTVVAKAQSNDDLKIVAKPIVTIFADYKAGLGDMNSTSGFNITRAYLGYGASIGKNLSARVIFDVGDPGNDSSLERTAFVKNACVVWTEDNFSVEFGLVNTLQYDYQISFWGYRYLSTVFQDLNSYGPSADLGVIGKYKFTKNLSVDVSITNGEGFKTLNTNNNNRYGIGATYAPIKGLTLRAYYDYYTCDEGLDEQTALGVFAGYKNSLFSLGAEYNFQNSYKFIDGQDKDGYSAYGSFYLSNKLTVFGRYDSSFSKDDWNTSVDNNLFIGGLEYKVNKFLRFAPNVQSKKYKHTDASETYVMFNLEFKL